MFDKELLLRDGSTDLTGNETGQSVNHGVDRVFGNPLTYTVQVPSVSGTNPTLDIKIQINDVSDGAPATWQDLAIFDQISTAGLYTVEAFTRKPWRRFVATVSGVGADFGAVVIGAQIGKRTAVG